MTLLIDDTGDDPDPETDPESDPDDDFSSIELQDNLWIGLENAFTTAVGTRYTPDILSDMTLDCDEQALNILARIVPDFNPDMKEGFGANILLQSLWAITGGNWNHAAQILKRCGLTTREEILTQLATGLRQVKRRIEIDGQYRSPLLDELIRKNADIKLSANVAPPIQGTSEDGCNGPIAERQKSRHLHCRSVEEILQEIDQLAGMQHLRQRVEAIVANVELSRLREEIGLPASKSQPLHLALVGPAGTGKTTVARLLAEVYVAIGLLPEAKIIEGSRQSMVGLYVGSSALRTADTVREAIGGVLFIDEAYSISDDRYGKEAMAELVRLMENHRDEFAVFFAGYPDEMKEFFKVNPGFASRVSQTLHFQAFTNSELWNIVDRFATIKHYVVDPTLRPLVDRWFDANRKLPGFGNARAARNLVDQMITAHALRVRKLPKWTSDDLVLLTKADLQSASVPEHQTATTTYGYQ